MLEIGQKAPEFTSRDENGNEIKLSDYKGKKVVLYFYPKDNSPGCTRQACYFRDTKAEFEEKDAIILGVSLDTDNSHRRFQEKHDLNFPLISDREKNLARRFGVLRLGGLLGLKRVTFIIDKEGTVIKVIHSETNMHIHIDSALKALDSL